MSFVAYFGEGIGSFLKMWCFIMQWNGEKTDQLQQLSIDALFCVHTDDAGSDIRVCSHKTVH